MWQLAIIYVFSSVLLATPIWNSAPNNNQVVRTAKKDAAAQSTAPSPSSSHISISSIRLLSSRTAAAKSVPSELTEWQESTDSPKHFAVACPISDLPGFEWQDLLLWTTVNFVVAPADQHYASLSIEELGEQVGSGLVTSMQDINAVPLYDLRPGRTRKVVLGRFALGPLLATFPPTEKDNLWPWVMRITIHIQDRDGHQIASESKSFLLQPSAERIKNQQ
jgi:hypothetical protein